MMKALLRLLAFLFVLALSIGISFGQGQIRFELLEVEADVPVGSRFIASVRAEISRGWHLYSMNVPTGGPIPTTLTVQENAIFAPAGDPQEPTPIPWFDRNFNMQTNYFKDSVDFEVPVIVQSSAAPGDHELSIKVRFMLCDESSCLPPQTKTVRGFVPVIEGEGLSAVLPSEDSSGPLGDTLPPDSAGSTESSSVESALPIPKEGGAGPVIAYIWFAMTMGALALLTPCVFPMIPITVSYFTKRNAKSRKQAVFEAGLYSVGIVATFTVLGFLLTFLFGAGGINRLAASPLVNLFIAAVFVVFALSLFGVLELTIPSSWLTAVNKKSSETTGVLGILLMALTFSLTSFTCTVPFVGTVMVAALSGEGFGWSLLGVTAFATVFSLPFFLLALFPSWLQNLPKSGNWMNSVKITMGFLELAAALKFASNVDLVFQWEILTRPVFITIWLAIGIVLFAYLLGWYRFPHETLVESVGAFRVLFAVLFLAVSLYLLRGLFGFSLGELDAFLPPRDYGAVSEEAFFSSSGQGTKERWLSDYASALARAKAENRPIFLDFTGYTCTNCRWMEANVFTLPAVQKLFTEFVLVRLYTDGGEPVHEQNMQLEQERYQTIALPFYAIVAPDDSTIATFPGLTRNPQKFIEFLKKGL